MHELTDPDDLERRLSAIESELSEISTVVTDAVQAETQIYTEIEDVVNKAQETQSRIREFVGDAHAIIESTVQQCDELHQALRGLEAAFRTR